MVYSHNGGKTKGCLIEHRYKKRCFQEYMETPFFVFPSVRMMELYLLHYSSLALGEETEMKQFVICLPKACSYPKQ